MKAKEEIWRPKTAEWQSPFLNRAPYLIFPCREDVKRLLAAYTKETGQAGLEIAFAEYSSNWGSTPTQTTIKTTAVDIGTDYLFLVPIQTAIFQHAANAKWGQLLDFFAFKYLVVAILKIERQTFIETSTCDISEWDFAIFP